MPNRLETIVVSVISGVLITIITYFVIKQIEDNLLKQ